MTAPNITGTTPLSSTSFIANWTITDPDHNYIVTWTSRCSGMMDSMSITVPGNTMSHMVTGLDGVSNYNVSVTTINSCGMMMSEPVTVYGTYVGINVHTHKYRPDLPKCALIVHNFSVHFSPPPNGCNNILTVLVCIKVKNFNSLLLLRLLFSDCLTSIRARVVYKWLHLPWTSRQPAGITTQLASETEHT